jgi:putative transcriptional regulator
MGFMSGDRACEQAEAFALGALDPADASAYAEHLASCPTCRGAVALHESALGRVAVAASVPPDPALRRQVLDLADAPRLEDLDLDRLEWQEAAPGVRIHVLKDDPERGLRACLAWAKPGASNPRHRHVGDEVILVLRGALGDERGVYGPGEICRSRAGSKHSERAMPGDDCVCYVLYYGPLEYEAS